MYQISFYIPEKHLENVKNAMFMAGAGKFNNYENCAWQTIGTGQFKPIKSANPASGSLNKLEIIKEYKVEMLAPKANINKIISAMKKAHPYEEVAYFVTKIKI